MTTAVIPFMQAAVPAHIASAFVDNSNIAPAVSVPSLTFRGKVWRINLKGEETPLMKDDEPVQTVRVVVLACTRQRLRSYYEGKYVEGEHRQPTCYSNDGERPDPAIQEPKGETCATCPMNVKGSATSAAGKAVTACQGFKRLVVIPETDFDFEPLVMRIPQTSLWDAEAKELEAKGWFAWDQYLTFLRGRSVTHTAAIVTKMRFDPRQAYPKVIFSPDRWLEPNEVAKVAELIGQQKVKDLLEGKFEKAQEVAAPEAEVEEAPAPKPAPKKEPPKSAAKKPADPLDDLEGFDEPPAPKKEPPKPAAKKEPAKPAPKQEEDPLDDLFAEEVAAFKPAAKKEPPKPAAKKEPAKAAPKEEAAPAADDDGLAELLSGWED